MALAVIDASVVVKWFLEEADSGPALRLRSDFFEGILRVRVPGLLPYEVANALRYSRRFRKAELAEAARDLDRSGFVTVPLFGDVLERTVAIAVDEDLSIYDASYLALAELEGCPLYTADEALVSLRRTTPEVVHIREYPANP